MFQKYFANFFAIFSFLFALYLIGCWIELKMMGNFVTYQSHAGFVTNKNGESRPIDQPFKNKILAVRPGEKINFVITKINRYSMNVVNERIFQFANDSEIVLLQNRRTYSPETIQLEIFYEVPTSAKGCDNEVFTRIYISLHHNLLSYLSPKIEIFNLGLNICIAP